MAESIYYIAIGRDDAKRLFATKEPAALRELAAAWIGANSQSAGGKMLRLGNELALLRRQLGAYVDEEPPAVKPMFAGSHKLAEEEDFSLSVIRPDFLRPMADVLTKFVVEQTGENQAALAQFQQFFAAAAENREAVAIVRSAAENPA